MTTRAALLAVIAFCITMPASAKEARMNHATGTFEVTVTPEASGDAPAGGLPTSRMAITKRFDGGLQGSATGTMLAAGTPVPGQPAGYVAVDQVAGRLDGREGGFLLLHRGTMTRSGDSALSVTIAPDSGWGALAGIAGTLSIEAAGGTHRYDLAYTLPAGG